MNPIKFIFFIIITIFFLSFNACNSSENPTEKKLDANPPISIGSPNKPYQMEMLRPFSFHLVGNIGSNEMMELFLSYNPHDLNNNCISVEGDYNNPEEQKSSTSLVGELCLDEGKITLHSPKNEQHIESFKGQLTGHLAQINGQYLSNNNSNNGLFELKNRSQQITPKTAALFAEKLQDQLKKSQNFTFEKIGVDEKGIFIKDLKADNLSIKSFSSSNFKWTKTTTSNNLISDHTETIDLWFYNDNAAFVIVVNSITWEEKQLENGAFTETESIHHEVWKYNGTSFENIFLENPKKTDLSKINWHAITKNGVLQLHQNKPEGLWEWQN